MEARHVVEVALMKVGSRYGLHLSLTACTANLLDIIDKGTRWSDMIDAVYIGNIHTHAKCLGGYDETLLSLTEGTHDGRLLLLLLLTIVGGHVGPALRSDPTLGAHIQTAGKGEVEQRLVMCYKLLYPTGYHALFGLVVGLALIEGQPADVKADVLPSGIADIEHAGSHLQRVNGLHHHVGMRFVAPYGGGRKGKEGERIAQLLLEQGEVTAQEPVIHTKLTSPGGDGVRLVNHHHADAAMADEAMDVVCQEQFRREVEDIGFTIVYPTVGLGLLLRRKVARSVGHSVVSLALQALHLVENQRLEGLDDQGEQTMFTPQIDGRQLKEE